MAPRPVPVESSFLSRRSKPAPGSKPSIFAIAADGPMKGVHVLSAEPLPPEIQYLYRHPINVHKTFLTVSGDFLRRRFDSIDAAVRWLDEVERERELIASLSAASLSGPPVSSSIPLSSSSSALSSISTASVSTSTSAPTPTSPTSPLQPAAPPASPRTGHQRRNSEPVALGESLFEGLRRREQRERRGKELARRGGVEKRGTLAYSYSHLGVRRRELLYTMATGADSEVLRLSREMGLPLETPALEEGVTKGGGWQWERERGKKERERVVDGDGDGDGDGDEEMEL